MHREILLSISQEIKALGCRIGKKQHLPFKLLGYPYLKGYTVTKYRKTY